MTGGEFVDRRAEARAAAQVRAAALDAAVGAIVRYVPDLGALIHDLETTGGSAKLVAALRTRVGVRPADIGGEARPDAAMWSAAAERSVGGRK